MEELNELKQKIQKFNTYLSKIQQYGISQIDKDIILSEIRELYKYAMELSVDDTVIEKSDEKIPTINIIEEKSVDQEKNIFENNDNTIAEKESINIEENKDDIAANTVAEEKIEPNVDLRTDDDIEKNNIEIKSESALEIEFGEDEDDSELFKDEIDEDANIFPTNNSAPKTIADELGKNRISLNEKYAKDNSNFSQLINLKPLQDIKSGIGLGDRFLYIRELFDGKNDLFDQTIEHLNKMKSFDDAVEFLDEKFHWDANDSTVATFLNVVKRKYI
jgi:hypothetical protein